MSFSRCLLTSTVLAGVVFSALTLPLTATGSKLVTIQWEGEPIFTGQLRELAPPYLGLTTAMSLGVGLVSLTALGWRQTSQKLASTKEQMAALADQLKEQETLLEDLKISTVKFDTKGLEFFLQEENKIPEPAPAITNPVSEYTVLDPDPSVTQFTLASTPIVSHSEPVKLSPVMSSHTKHQAATALASAQAFMGFARPTVNEASHAPAPKAENAENVVQLDTLLTHLKQVMAQIEQLHGSQTPLQEARTQVTPILEQQEVAA